MVEFSIEREEKLGWIFPFLQRYFLIRLSHYAATTFHGLRTLCNYTYPPDTVVAISRQR